MKFFNNLILKDEIPGKITNDEPEIEVGCHKCDLKMSYLGKIPFRVGGMQGIAGLLVGSWADVNEELLHIDVYRCDSCRKLELFDNQLELTSFR